MKKVLLVISIAVLGLYVGYTTYRAITKNRAAEGVTIRVLTPDNVPAPIPETTIRLESEDGRSAIQNMTNGNGEVFFHRITTGTYRIRATHIYCDGGDTEAHVMSVKIQGSNVQINYFPCY